MFNDRKISREEMKKILTENIQNGYIKEVTMEHYSLTNKGMGKLTEHLLDFVDVMRDVESYKNYPHEYLIQVATESMLQTFGSKLQIFIALNNTEWKGDLKKQLEMPIEELMEHVGITDEDLASMGINKTKLLESSGQKPVEQDDMDKESNVIILKNKKNETMH